MSAADGSKRNWMSRLRSHIAIRNLLVRECFAEVLGTFILLAFGDGVVAQVVLSRGTTGTFLSINICWGLAVAIGVYAAGGISGGHINPAVSVCQFLLGNISLLRCLLYQVAQYLGAFLGAACVYLVYHDAITAYDGGVRQVFGPNATAGIFSTYPQTFLSLGGGLLDQVVGTALLLIGILCITDKRNMETPKGLVPIAVGLLVMAIGESYGFNCGYAINPARDLSPRIFTAIAGWGSDVFTYKSPQPNWFLIPLLGPYLGALVGTLIYQLLVALHWPQAEVKGQEEQ